MGESKGMDDAEKLPYLKRIAECCQADPEFQQAYSADPAAVLREYRIDLDPASLNELLATARSCWESHAIGIARELQGRALADDRFQAWRQRQIKRIEAFHHVEIFRSLVHVPIAFELSRGCSGRCFFCCFDPPPLSGVFPYSEANSRFWREILSISMRLVGPLFGRGAPCYYATEPLDNPDYERLTRDFREITGFWPPLTTVKCVEDPKRIRQYIRAVTSDSDHTALLRFSVTSLRMLREVHSEYTAEELAEVELVLNNPESSWKYSPAGRARRIVERVSQNDRMAHKFYMPGPTACVTGFVVNLVDRSIRLVATCPPDERNPFGYILFDNIDFQTPQDYERGLEELIAQHMPVFPHGNSALAFSPGFKLEATEGGCQFSTDFMTRRLPGDTSFVKMCELIDEGRYTWTDLCAIFDDAWMTEMYLKPKLRLLFDLGLLREPTTRRS
jgi:radical SAM family RiPP maturation amino acid epimerase